MGNRERSLVLKPFPTPCSLFLMRSAWLIAIAAVLTSGCASWSGPRAAVEDRPVAKKAVATREAARKSAPQKTASKAAEKHQREERRAAKEVKSLNAKNARSARETPGDHSSVDALSAHHHIPDVAPPL